MYKHLVLSVLLRFWGFCKFMVIEIVSQARVCFIFPDEKKSSTMNFYSILSRNSEVFQFLKKICGVSEKELCESVHIQNKHARSIIFGFHQQLRPLGDVGPNNQCATVLYGFIKQEIQLLKLVNYLPSYTVF